MHWRYRYMKILLSIGGASGSIYGIRILEELKKMGAEVHLIISNGAKKIINNETNFEVYVESWKTLEETMSALENMDINSSTIFNISFGSFNFDENGNLQGLALSPEDLKTVVDYIHSRGGKVNGKIENAEVIRQ